MTFMKSKVQFFIYSHSKIVKSSLDKGNHLQKEIVNPRLFWLFELAMA